MNMLNAHPPPTCMRSHLCDYCRHRGRWSLMMMLPLPPPPPPSSLLLSPNMLTCAYVCGCNCNPLSAGSSHTRYGPHFEDVPTIGNVTNITVPIGNAVYLNCRISLLQDKTVRIYMFHDMFFFSPSLSLLVYSLSVSHTIPDSVFILLILFRHLWSFFHIRIRSVFVSLLHSSFRCKPRLCGNESMSANSCMIHIAFTKSIGKHGKYCDPSYMALQ